MSKIKCNEEAVRKVRDYLASRRTAPRPGVKHVFNMECFGDDDTCGTAACIAGTTILLLGNSDAFSISRSGSVTFYYPPDRLAAKLLGLSPGVSHRLFYACTSERMMPDLSAITRRMAVEALDRLLEGKEPWEHLAT